MAKKKFISITSKLTYLLSFSAILGIILASGATYIHTVKVQTAKDILALSQLTEIVALNLFAAVEFDDEDSSLSILKTLESNENLQGAYIKVGDDIFSSHTRLGVSDDEIKVLLKGVDVEHQNRDSFEYIDLKHIVVTRPISFENKAVGSLTVISDTKALEQTLVGLLVAQALAALAALIIAVIIARFLQKMFTTPIFSLGDAIKYISTSNKFDITVETESNDEFKLLFNGFNKMVSIINNQNNELKSQKEFVTTLLNSQDQIIVTIKGADLSNVNKSFLTFLGLNKLEDFKEQYNTNRIYNLFSQNAPKDYIHAFMDGESWIDYIINRPKVTHKIMIHHDNQDHIFSVAGALLPSNDNLKSAVFTDITEMEKAKQEIEEIHKNTRDSIEYSSLIQGALIPESKQFNQCFDDYFSLWHPKDIVGGDIYFFEELSSQNEYLLMVIDCTGHGVPGAFVTMLVKAIEREIVSSLRSNIRTTIDETTHGLFDSSGNVSPAKILTTFNRIMKQLLKQEGADSISNAGFDGGIIYYNKKEKIMRFAGAETPLFYMEDGGLTVIKGSRHSIGYKKSDVNFEFQEHSIDVTEGMQFYLTTDGYIDQNGGEKGFCFGKKRFQNLIIEHHQESMADQQKILLNELSSYQGDEERNDDVTIIGIKI